MNRFLLPLSSVYRQAALKLAVLLIAAMATGCYQMNRETLGSSETNNASNIAAQNVDCQFVSVPILSSTLYHVLGIEEADVSILESDETYLKKYAQSLGQGDPSEGVPDDKSCSALKYKVATQLMIDACQLAFENNPDLKGSLFPYGMADYRSLFTIFMGRSPDPEEVQVLDQLRSEVSSEIFPAAACAAVTSSMESLSQS